jgi:hypothetical protein
MNLTDPRAQAAFDAAINHIKTTTAAVADRVADHLGILATAATRIIERDVLVSAQLDLRRNMSTFVVVFGDTLSKRVTRELNPQGSPGRKFAETDWQSLSLVEDAEVEEQMFSDRISQAITHACEWEMREMAAYTGSLLGIGRADHDRNPLRAEVLGAAAYRGIGSVSSDREARKVLAREIGLGLARVMPTCYADLLKDFRARGVQPVGLTVRGVEGPGNELARDRVNSGYQTLRDNPPTTGSGTLGSISGADMDAAGPFSHQTGQGGRSGLRSGGSTGGGGSGGGNGGGGSGGSWGGGGATTGSGGTGTRAGNAGPAGSRTGASSGSGGSNRPAASPADAELMALIRRLTFLATRPSDLGNLSTPQALATGSGSGLGAAHTGSGAGMGATDSGSYGEGLSRLMAVNLIRTHREELRQASTGTLDHMVIDVVGSLFDQILSDPRVPPQMARQIARLQLPVLRVALHDNSFFSSRKHPVRRFVNRIASLACAFEEFDDGPGKQFLARVRDLVQEIVEGDFDQIELYTSKLGELESFIAQQARQDVQANASAVSVVDGKEADLRIQQRYMMQLQAALMPLAMEEYLRIFLAQVWSQALAMGIKRDGVQSELVQRLKRVGRDLVMSVQPKGSPAMRKKFLMQLPPLMKDLNEGMKLIGWPEVAQKEFFGKLLPAHAESLKGQPLTELEYNLLAKQLEAVFNTPLPEPDALLRNVPMTSTGVTAPEPQFTPEEAKKIGLIEESAVDWSGEVDIDLSAEADAVDTQAGEMPPMSADPDSLPDISLGLDINLDLSPSEPAEPSHGPQLMDHVKLGFAYQMHLNEQWQKVRLSYVSPGRAFFVFSRGKRHQETVSLTARMLARMCETNRFRAFENAYLMERATARARKQLAALSATSKV